MYRDFKISDVLGKFFKHGMTPYTKEGQGLNTFEESPKICIYFYMIYPYCEYSMLQYV